MQELMGKVTALDPEVTQSLKVISYFDALVAGGVNLETLVRGAAALTGTVAGLRAPGVTIRVDGDGRLRDEPVLGDPAARWPSRGADDASLVWLERDGHEHANDALVLERLALAVAVMRARRKLAPDDALQVAIDESAAADVRAAALARLRLDGVRLRAVALPAEARLSAATTLVATAHGVVRAGLLREDDAIPEGRAGLGTWAIGAEVATSWRSALAAFRLAEGEPGAVDAEHLGMLLSSALASTHLVEHPDVVAIAGLDARSRAILDALANAESVRAAASSLSMHHSTLQARHDALTKELGFDPRTSVGRARYELARLVARLAETRSTP